MSFAVWDFIFSCPGFKSVLPVAFTCAVQTSTGASRRANRGCLRLRWCCFPTPPLTGHKSPHRGEFGFSLQNKLTPPPKGGGAGFCSSLGFRVLLGSRLWQLLATTGPHSSNRARSELRWCRFPTSSSKPHTGASLVFACWLAILRRITPFRQFRVRTQAEEKTPLPLF